MYLGLQIRRLWCGCSPSAQHQLSTLAVLTRLARRGCWVLQVHSPGLANTARFSSSLPPLASPPQPPCAFAFSDTDKVPCNTSAGYSFSFSLPAGKVKLVSRPPAENRMIGVRFDACGLTGEARNASNVGLNTIIAYHVPSATTEKVAINVFPTLIAPPSRPRQSQQTKPTNTGCVPPPVQPRSEMKSSVYGPRFRTPSNTGACTYFFGLLPSGRRPMPWQCCTSSFLESTVHAGSSSCSHLGPLE